MKSNVLQIFDYEDHTVRTVVDDNGTVWFNANDAAKCLEYTNPRKAIADHVDEEDVTKRDTLSAGGTQQANYVNESGLYCLIFGSKKETAKRFRLWVTREVLPALRETGRYEIDGHGTENDNSPIAMMFEDIPLDERRFALNLVKQAAHQGGRKAAAEVWNKTVLRHLTTITQPVQGVANSTVNSPVHSSLDDGYECLYHITDNLEVRGAIIRTNCKHWNRKYAKFGIRYIDDNIVIANQHPFLQGLFEKTKFDGAWRSALLSIPGAYSSSGVINFSGKVSRAVIIPPESVSFFADASEDEAA